MFKEMFGQLNESTPATIVVKSKNEYYISVLQADGYPQYVLKILDDKFYSQKNAEKLVQKTGEIRSLNPLKYYADRTILIKTTNEKKVYNAMNKTTHKYYWDGQDWWFDSQSVNNFDDMLILDDENLANI